MPRKPPLSVVATDSTMPKPPRKLGEHGMALWRSVHAEYDIEDVGGIELLTQAAQALDRAEALAACIEHDGEVYKSRAGPKAHPAVKDELACRAFVVRTLQKLGLNLEQVKSVGRPPGVGPTWGRE
jgi:hypothetical protein